MIKKESAKYLECIIAEFDIYYKKLFFGVYMHILGKPKAKKAFLLLSLSANVLLFETQNVAGHRENILPRASL